jgi:hypothetical protein
MADDDDLLTVMKEVRDLQREALDRQTRFLWILLPIFAMLCVQVVLMLIL